MIKFKNIILIILFVIIFSGCTKIEEYEYKKVTAIVANKYYSPSSTSFIMAGDTPIYFTDPEYYNITFSYDKLVRTFDNQKYYNLYNVNDKVEMMLISGYDKDNKLVYQNLGFIENSK